MNDATPSTLILVPTELESTLLNIDRPWLDSTKSRIEIVGFGVVAAAVGTAQLLNRVRPQRVVLVGIAGTYKAEDLGIGAAAAFTDVFLEGIGGIGTAGTVSADEMGFAAQEALHLAEVGGPAAGLLTVTATSLDAATAASRQRRFPQCVCEDMEGFAVAAACAAWNTPLAIVRGVSNVAGDRNKERWDIGSALDAASILAKSVIEKTQEADE